MFRQIHVSFLLPLGFLVVCLGCDFERSVYSEAEQQEFITAGPPRYKGVQTAEELEAPVALRADGKVIDIGALPNTSGHAGPCVGDIDADGDEDLLVGDFPGNFWFFENVSESSGPVYAGAVKLQAGGVDAVVNVF